MENKKMLLELARKEDKNKSERDIVCDNCAWCYNSNECVRNSINDCESPILTGFKPNWIWELIKTPATMKITDIEGNKKDFKYTKFSIKKI